MVTYHRLIFQAGENIVERLLDFSRTNPQDSFYIVEASGTISRVEFIRTDGGTETFEGHFTIVHVTGTYTFPEKSTDPRTWYLGVKFAGQLGRDGPGGRVRSSLIAAGPVEILLVAFREARPRRIINVSSGRRGRGPEPGSSSRSQPLGPSSTSGSQPPEPGPTEAPQPPAIGPASALMQSPEPRTASIAQPPEPGSSSRSQTPELSVSDFEIERISFRF